MLNFMQILSGISSGTLDAKSEVCKMLSNMTPQQRETVMGLVSQAEGMAKQAGLSTEGFQSEVSAHLT